jgi:alcohol dehydrogenase
MIAGAKGARVVAIDINRENLALAKEFGAEHTIDAGNETDPVREIRELTRGGAHISLDALGSEVTSHNSIACLRKRGKHIQVGLMTDDHRHPAVPMDRVLSDELEIIGSHGMQAHKYPEMLQMIAEGKLKPEKLVKETIALEQVTAYLPAMDRFSHHGVVVINRF